MISIAIGSLSKALSQLQLLRAEKGDLAAAGEAVGLFRLRWPAGRREVAGTVWLSPAGREGCSLGPSVSRVRCPGGVGEAVAAASFRNKSSRTLPRPVGAPLRRRRRARGGGTPFVEYLYRSQWPAAIFPGGCCCEVGAGFSSRGWGGGCGFCGCGGRIELDFPAAAVVVNGELRFKTEGARGLAPADGRSLAFHLVLRNEWLLRFFAKPLCDGAFSVFGLLASAGFHCRRRPGADDAGSHGEHRLNSGKVVAVGPGDRDKEGKLIPVGFKEGDHVLLPEYGGLEVKLGAEKEYLLFREHDILGTLHE